jgi:hypothetical protein
MTSGLVCGTAVGTGLREVPSIKGPVPQAPVEEAVQYSTVQYFSQGWECLNVCRRFQKYGTGGTVLSCSGRGTVLDRSLLTGASRQAVGPKALLEHWTLSILCLVREAPGSEFIWSQYLCFKYSSAT